MMVTKTMLPTYEEKNTVKGKEKRFVTALDLIKCLKSDQITAIAPYVRIYV